jgi:hypothetical protein
MRPNFAPGAGYIRYDILASVFLIVTYIATR